MEPFSAPLAFLSKLPLYSHQKPYIVIPAKRDAEEKSDEETPLDNLDFSQVPVLIRDMRSRDKSELSENGFQKFDHHFDAFTLDEASVLAYREETEQVLKEVLGADAVLCYDFRVRLREQTEDWQLD
jgi:hypothetical protein